jgi:hypothetical protein
MAMDPASTTHDLSAAEQTVFVGRVHHQFVTSQVLANNMFNHRMLSGSWDTLWPVINRQQHRHEADGVNRMGSSGSSENSTETALQLAIDLPLKGDQLIPYSERTEYGFDPNGLYVESLARGAIADRQFCILATIATAAAGYGQVNSAFNLDDDASDLDQSAMLLLSQMSATFTQNRVPYGPMQRFACVKPSIHAALERNELVKSRDFTMVNFDTKSVHTYLYFAGWTICTTDVLFGVNNSSETRYATKYRFNGTAVGGIFWHKNAVAVGDVVAPQYNIVNVEHYDTYLAKSRQHFGTGVIPGFSEGVYTAISGG